MRLLPDEAAWEGLCATLLTVPYVPMFFEASPWKVCEAYPDFRSNVCFHQFSGDFP